MKTPHVYPQLACWLASCLVWELCEVQPTCFVIPHNQVVDKGFLNGYICRLEIAIQIVSKSQYFFTLSLPSVNERNKD